MQHLDLCRTNIDYILLLAGIALAVCLPILLIDEVARRSSTEFAFLLATFEVTGLACCTTGLRGLLDCFHSIEQRRHSLIVTIICFSVVAILGVAVHRVADAHFVDETVPAEKPESQSLESIVPTHATWFEKFLDIRRIAMACVGAMLGYYLATLRPPPDQARNFWFSVLAAAAAYLTAYVILSLLLVVAGVFVVWQFVRPHLPSLAMKLQGYRNAADPTLANTNANRIADLQQQIAWTQSSAAPQAYQNEEVARLQQQIRSLGGSP